LYLALSILCICCYLYAECWQYSVSFSRMFWKLNKYNTIQYNLFLVKKAMLSSRDNLFFCRKNSGRSLRIFSSNRCKMVHLYAELTDCIARANSLSAMFMSKKIMNILLILLSTCLAFIGLGWVRNFHSHARVWLILV
jgi:hypothetical protein